MLEIIVPEQEFFDNSTQRFIKFGEVTLVLEHSLMSLARWESKWHKAFFSMREKTDEETRDYVRCMTLNKKVPDDVYYRLTDENISEINRYIEDPMSALKFYDGNGSGQSRELMTAETFYYWMFQQNVPLECEKWHLKRLISLLRYSSNKSNPKKNKNRSPQEIAERNARICEENRKRFNTRG